MERFTLAYWASATRNETRLLNAPCITLAQVDEVYEKEGLCRTIVSMNFMALYQVGGGRGTYKEAIFHAAVDRFISKHGNACTMFDLLLYCDAYRDTYKDEFTRNEDFMDYSRQFPRYLTHKAAKLEESSSEEREQKQGAKLVGKPALEAYLRKAAARGDNLLQGGLVAFGMVTPQHAKEVMERYGAKPF